MKPRISSRFANIPLGRLTHVENLLASAIKDSVFTSLNAASRSLLTLVNGITAVLIIGLPVFWQRPRVLSISFVKVASVMRAGIQPSQYSTARRQAAGVPPPYQIGIGLTGVGLSATSVKSK